MIRLSSPTESQPAVLVIGATGRHGNTGAAVVDQLIAHGRNVRVLTRTNDDRAEALRHKGAATIIGDLHESLPAALDGVSAVYFTYPIAPGVIPPLRTWPPTTFSQFVRKHREEFAAALT